MNRWTLGGAALLALWIILAFVMAWPSGWAHTPLALGVIAIARGMVEAEEARNGKGDE